MDGRFYEPCRFWVDVFESINKTPGGWFASSGAPVNSNVVLVRNPRMPLASASENLRDLLIRKVNEGISVMVLDDRLGEDSRHGKPGHVMEER
jgi:phospholipase D1/2